jgi:hypothetical protein
VLLDTAAIIILMSACSVVNVLPVLVPPVTAANRCTAYSHGRHCSLVGSRCSMVGSRCTMVGSRCTMVVSRCAMVTGLPVLSVADQYLC